MVRVSARRQTRIEEVKRLTGKLREATSVILTDYRGLTVAQVTELRRALREASAEYRVVKNSLTQLAARELGIQELERYLEGPTAMAFSDGDLVVAAKVLTTYSKKVPVLQIKAGVVDGRVLPKEEVVALAELPPREVLLGRLMGLMVAPLQGLVGGLAGSLRGFVVGLDQVRQKREGAGT
ncbi:MAG: 50S ribosomal protein L10 [Candidatus Methylomirabilales bacterium]